MVEWSQRALDRDAGCAEKEGRGVKNIAIVEDEQAAAERLTAYIQRYAGEFGQQFNITRFCDGEAFLQNYKTIYAVVFLDIQMPRKNGMDAAEELRRYDKNVSIIFITNLVQYALKGYEVDAVSFLLKPVSYYDFSLKFKKALDIYLMNEERSFTVNAPGGLCRISTDKLMYVEIINHRLHYHLCAVRRGAGAGLLRVPALQHLLSGQPQVCRAGEGLHGAGGGPHPPDQPAPPGGVHGGAHQLVRRDGGCGPWLRSI